MKKQTTSRMSDATREKLEWLASRYGTATEVLAVAIDRLYESERGMDATLTMSAERLRAMQDNECALYWTPGDIRPYWANKPQWRDDRQVADVTDFLASSPFDSLDGVDDDWEFSLKVTRP